MSKTLVRFFILVCLMVFSCHKEEAFPLCDTENPVKNLKWLSDFIKEVKSDTKYHSVTISVFEYHGQTVFNIYDVVQS